MKNMRFTLWNVEHGISIWVVTPNGHNHWFDSGKTSEFSPAQYVAQKYGVTNIDYLVISHPDKDHVEDLPNFNKFFQQPMPRTLTINKSLPFEEFIGSSEADYQKIMGYLYHNYTALVPEELSPLNPYYNGGIEYRQFSLNYGRFPDRSKLEGNNTSIVTCMLYQGVLFICPGDIEPKGWNELWNQNKENLQSFIKKAKVKFLVAPHHGRESGYSKEMMDLIKPHVVFISDKWGDSTTHSEYYLKPSGITYNGEIIKCLSTKTNGRILCEVDIYGFKLNQFENEKTTYESDLCP